MIARGALCLVVVCLVVGCTPDPSPDDGSTSTTPTSPTTTMPSISMPPLTSLPPEPPPVTRSLDVSRYATGSTVCDLLTDAQAGELGILTPADSSTVGGGSLLTCRRKGSGTERDVEFYLWPDADVLVGEFGRPPDGYGRYLLDIMGQPAVVIRDEPDPESGCRVVVGLAARQGVEIMTSDEDDNACALAVAIAEQMVRNLGG